MAYSIDEAFGTLADVDMWEEAAAVTGGYLAPTLARNLLEGETDMDVPDEAYGIAVMAVGAYSPMYGGEIALGGGVYTVDTLLERVGLKQTVTGGNL
jgi:hypothetical protein